MGATVTVYAIPKDVQNFLVTEQAFDANSPTPAGKFESYILGAEGEFEQRTGTAFRPRLVTREIHDLEATRSRYKELFDDDWFSVPRPVHLNHRPIVPFDANRGHAMEAYEGADSAAFTGKWSPDYLADRTFGRSRDWWLDEMKGILYLRKNFLFRRASLFRITYEYGKPITLLNGAVTAAATTLTVDDTYRYETRGVVRVDDEYVFHTGKATTTLTGCTRGVLDTDAVAHDDNSEVYEVPDDIRRLVAMRAAQRYLENEVMAAAVADNAGTAPSFADKTSRWNAEWDKTIGTTYGQWRVM